MTHCNNCTTDLNAWVSLFIEYQNLLGINADKGEIYEKLFTHALEGDLDCGGLLNYNYIAGEHVTGFTEGRPLFVRSASSKFNLANFMLSQLYATVGVLKTGNEILFKEEDVQVDRITAHGGLFKTPVVGQRILAAALGTPISVMETAGEGGPWGMALLASYCADNPEGLPLADYLDRKVFAGDTGTEIKPSEEDIAGFNAWFKEYTDCLPVERAAVENKK